MARNHIQEFDESNLEKAQEIAFQAFEASSSKKRKTLALKALQHSEDCADAYSVLAEDRDDLNEKIELYTKAVEAGKRAIGKKDFEELSGHFWGYIETRPFMRAKEMLASCLQSSGQEAAAIAHYQEMLELNPHDNQGIRHELIPALFRAKRDKELEKLFKQYKHDAFAQTYYTHALWLFRKRGASATANRALRHAIELNPYVPKYLLGLLKMPKSLPDFMKLRSETEAAFYMDACGEDWQATPGALSWLNEHFESIVV